MRRLAALLVLLPDAALAHASGRMVALTLPTGWYILGAGVAVALTALGWAAGGCLPSAVGGFSTGPRWWRAA